MKRILLMAGSLLVTGMCFAQKDSTANNTDTVKVGNFIIIKKNKGNTVSEPSDNSRRNNTYELRVERRSRKRSNISTNW